MNRRTIVDDEDATYILDMPYVQLGREITILMTVVGRRQQGYRAP
jgi:hypothetical protein